MSETPILKRIVLALSNGSTRLFRNNSGFLQDKRGVYVHFGLGTGTSDLIGWNSMIVTPQMVGKMIAIFVAIEVKTEKGKPTEEQEYFILAVKKAGGIAGIARSTEEAKKIIS